MKKILDGEHEVIPFGTRRPRTTEAADNGKQPGDQVSRPADKKQQQANAPTPGP